jgi:hypothetical protein
MMFIRTGLWIENTRMNVREDKEDRQIIHFNMGYTLYQREKWWHKKLTIEELSSYPKAVDCLLRWK